ncbi:peptidyl-prolyl cis-trans isomerase [bacterium]|nr:peptidyl-prolyl cis-trans isomerase [bacterium]
MNIYILFIIACRIFIANPDILERQIDDEIIYQNALLYVNSNKNSDMKQRIFDKISEKKDILSKNYYSESLHKVSIINKIPISEIEVFLKRATIKEIFLNDTIFKNVDVSDEEIEKEYKNSFINLYKDEKILLYHLFSKSEQFLKKIKKDSEEKGVVDLNDWELIDWSTKDDLPTFFAPAFKLKDGSFSDIVVSEYGYHLFWLDKKERAHLPSKDEIKKEIYLKIIEKKQQEIFDKWVEEHKKKCEVITPQNFFNFWE